MQVGVRGGMEEISSVEILLKCDSQRKEVRSYFFIYLIHVQLQLPCQAQQPYGYRIRHKLTQQ
jgi:hypothetical protein